MSQLDSDLAAESVMQLSFSFEPRAYLDMPAGAPVPVNAAPPLSASACKPATTGVIVSFPKERSCISEHAHQAKLLRKILHRSRFF
jgi:hypothetical protein